MVTLYPTGTGFIGSLCDAAGCGRYHLLFGVGGSAATGYSYRCNYGTVVGASVTCQFSAAAVPAGIINAIKTAGTAR